MKSLLTQIFAKQLDSVRPTTNLDTVDVQFRRTTGRYAQKGTFSTNKGYLKVARDESTGRFTSVRGDQ